MKSNKGITLVVLVITIVVIIILAGVAIASITGRNNMINRAQESKEKSEEAKVNEEITTGEYETKIGEVAGGGSSGSVIMSAIEKAMNGDNSEINAIMENGGEMWIIDYDEDNNEMVYWITYQGETEYVHISYAGAKKITSLSSNAQRTVSDINVLKGLIGSSVKGYVSGEKINIPNFSIQDIDLYINTYGETPKIDIEYHDFLTFDFDLYIDNTENMTVLKIEQNG